MSAHYTFTNSQGVDYHLNGKQVTLRGGKLQTIYYFSKDVRDTAISLPEGYEVVENPRNGFCALKRSVK